MRCKTDFGIGASALCLFLTSTAEQSATSVLMSHLLDTNVLEYHCKAKYFAQKRKKKEVGKIQPHFFIQDERTTRITEPDM